MNSYHKDIPDIHDDCKKELHFNKNDYLNREAEVFNSRFLSGLIRGETSFEKFLLVKNDLSLQEKSGILNT